MHIAQKRKASICQGGMLAFFAVLLVFSGQTGVSGVENSLTIPALSVGMVQEDSRGKSAAGSTVWGEAETAACKAEQDDLRRSLQEALQQAEILTDEIQQLRLDHESLKKNVRLAWFAAGGVIMLVGFLAGLFGGRSRKYKSLLR